MFLGWGAIINKDRSGCRLVGRASSPSIKSDGQDTHPTKLGLTHGPLVLLPQNNGFVLISFLEAHLVNNGKFW